jgi:hypothetical protein
MSVEPVKANPYTSAVRAGAGTGPGPAGGGFEGVPKERVGGKMQFNTKGKYIAQGNQMRNQVCVACSIITLILMHFAYRHKSRR